MSELRVGSTSTLSGINSYRYVDTLYFTSSGTFVKADYPWLRALKVTVVGGGSGGSGCEASVAGRSGQGKGGGGGGAAIAFITDISALPSSVTVTSGAGSAGSGDVGSNEGGTSSFGSLCVATGGSSAPAGFTNVNRRSFEVPAAGGIGTVGDIIIRGGRGTQGAILEPGIARAMISGTGGASYLGHGAGPQNPPVQDAAQVGVNANLYGAGGGPGMNIGVAPECFGGNGSSGIVLVELYA